MPEITPSFVMSYERNMRTITENEYARRLTADHIWWNDLAKFVRTEKQSERISWLLETAMIEPIGPTGSGAMGFQNLVSQSAEYPSYRHGKGIIIQRDQLEDLDGTGLSEAAAWSSQIGSDMAYYPQRLFAQLLLNGAATDGSATAYDTVPFFADNTARTLGGNSVKGHPYNPFNTALGGYQNWLKGASSGAYPGALPIDDSVSFDTALVNLGKAIAHVSTNKMPNGVDPRFLTPAFIIAPPRMAPRLRQLMSAKFAAQMAGALSANNFGAGSADVEAIISGFGLGRPIIAQELGASVSYTFDAPFIVASTGNTNFISETVTGSDTTWYMVTQEAASSQLGSLLYVLRKDFRVNYYTGDNGGTGMQADLDRRNEFEYHVQGRMAAQYGHPYGVYRFDAS